MNSCKCDNEKLASPHQIVYFNLTQQSTHHSFKKVLCKMFWVELHKMEPGGQPNTQLPSIIFLDLL